MSILANGLTEHQVPDIRDHTTMIARLLPTVPDLIQVRKYWSTVDPNFAEPHPTWTFVHHGEGDCEHLAYYGPGGFGIIFGAQVAEIQASCRYSGFATIPAMQAAHLPAFRSVARAIGGKRLILMPEENGHISDALRYEGASLDICIDLIRKRWGNPHSPTEITTEDIEAYYKNPVWYLEKLENAI